MINLLVDECYAYDYLAILQVKKIKIINKDKLESEKLFDTCNDYIRKQVGELKHMKVICSPEYSDLVKANLLTFEAVELARHGEISAKETDACNMERFSAKQKLQKKFFPNQSISEVKS